MSVQNIYDKLMISIGNPFGVCGLMGNIKAESGMISNNVQNSCEARLGMNDAQYTVAVDSGIYLNFGTDRVGYGLCQWTSSGRKTGLLNYAKATNRSIGDEDMQIEWLIHELSVAYKSVFSTLKSAKSVKEASDAVVLKFERPKSVLPESSETTRTKTLTARQKLGEEFYNQLVRGKSNLKICIDAGHYLGTPGKRCLKSLDPEETREWILNDRIADKLESMLEDYDCEVLRADDTTGSKDVSLSDRAKKSNNFKSDVYISIHHNAGINGGKGGGTVVYYYSSDKKRPVQANSLYNSIVAQTSLKGNRAEPIKKKRFTVLSNTNAPAFLIENGFMDSQSDVPIILTEDHAIRTAKGILSWLITTWNLKEIKKPQNSNSTATINYRVQCGAFNSKEDAEILAAKLKAAGFEAIIVNN